MSVYDRWHLAHPGEGARRCSQHRKVPSAGHGTGLRWQVRGTDPDGKAIRQSFSFEQDARDFDAELRAAVRSGTFVDERAGRVTFRGYAENWRKQRTHDHSSAERVEAMLRNHCYEKAGGKTATGRMAIGQYPMAVLSRRVSLLRDWVADLNLEANSALLLIGLVKSVFAAAVDDRVIGRNPLKAASVTRPKRIRTEVIPWTPEEVEGTCAALPARLQALGYLGAVTGPRQGELLGLAVEDLDFLRRTVRYSVQVAWVGGRSVFKPVKNDRPRVVPVAAPVLPVLARHLELYPPVPVTLPWSEKGSRLDGKPVTRLLVFTTPGGTAWLRQQANRPWHAAWKAAGVPDRGRTNGMHILRHSAASRWLAGGLNPAKVADFLGDTLAIVVSVYLHFLPADDEVGRAIMDDYVTPSILPYEATKRPETALHGTG